VRTRTPGLRWFDSEADFPRRCDAFASYGRGQSVEEAPPHYSSVVDALNALTREVRPLTLVDVFRMIRRDE
jgi:hypothetical protein